METHFKMFDIAQDVDVGWLFKIGVKMFNIVLKHLKNVNTL